jgi:1-acyl-sn-glycerol-3-phosphate acyltransferase
MLYESDLVLADPRDLKKYFLDQTTTRQVLTPVARLLFKGFADLQVSGVEHLPMSGPVVLVANHLTTFDVFPMQLALPRLIFFMGKAELFQNPLSDALLRRLGGFPVYRGARDGWAMQHARRVLEHEQVLGIFPEGSRSRGRGLSPAKTGAARLAIEAGCPVVPMGVDGSQRLFKGFPRRTRLNVNIGHPIWPEPNDSALDLTDRMMFAMAKLLPPALRGIYAEVPKGFRM